MSITTNKINTKSIYIWIFLYKKMIFGILFDERARVRNETSESHIESFTNTNNDAISNKKWIKYFLFFFFLLMLFEQCNEF